MNEQITTLIFSLLFLIFWLGITALISVMGGWYSLSKRLGVFILLISAVGYSAYSQSINIRDYKNDHILREARDDENDIYPESHVYLYIDMIDEKVIFSSGSDTYFGICDKGFSNILLDMNGDGFASETYNAINVPYWVVKENSIVNPDNKQFLDDLNELFIVYGEDPYVADNPRGNAIFQRMGEALINPDIENRDLYYLVYLHSLSHNRDSEWSPHAIHYLEEEVMSRYNLSQIPETIIIYRIEYNLKMKNYEEAALLIREACRRHPEHMVYRVYGYLYDNESNVAFAESDKNHWLYKEKIRVSEE